MNVFTRASEAAADDGCAGRWLANQMVPAEEEPSDYAEFGRVVHNALATNNTTGLTPAQVRVYEGCQEILAKAVGIVFGMDSTKAVAVYDPAKLEFSVDVDGIPHIGHPDAVFRYGTKVLIPDFKALRGDVPDASENLQLGDYVSLYYANTVALKEAVTVIIQPDVTREPELCLYNQEEIEKRFARMINRVRASHDPNSKRTPNPVSCKFCRAKRICNEYQAWAGSMVPVPRSIVDVPAAQWTPEQRAIFLENKSVAQKWLDDNEAAIKKLMEKDPEAVPGWTLKKGASVEVLDDLQTIYDRALARGVTHEAFMATLKGVKIKGKLEDALSEATKERGKALKQSMEQLTAGCSHKVDNSPSIKKKE